MAFISTSLHENKNCLLLQLFYDALMRSESQYTRVHIQRGLRIRPSQNTAYIGETVAVSEVPQTYSQIFLKVSEWVSFIMLDMNRFMCKLFIWAQKNVFVLKPSKFWGEKSYNILLLMSTPTNILKKTKYTLEFYNSWWSTSLLGTEYAVNFKSHISF